MKKFPFVLMITILFLSMVPASVTSAVAELNTDTVILSAADDAYYSLAEEIAEAEEIPIFHTFAEAAAADPIYLLWVVTPENLSESVLMDIGLEMNQLDGSISMGVISGRNIADARRLWQGSKQIDASQNVIINGEKKDKIEGGIIYGADSRRKPVGLSKDSVIEALATNSVIQVSMEGATGSWFDQVNDINVKSEDIPSLASSVILHYGCSTFKPWAENSIAMACLDQGAVAYAGFIDPSITGKRFGDYEDIAFLYTWEEFPLGHLVQIQNQAAMQHAAAMPHFFLLGDPRLYARSEKPYTMLDDEETGERRVLHLMDVESGLIPIKIDGGAGYDFVNVCGLDAASMDSAFFNDRLQMVDIRGDKYLFIDNTNGSDTLTIEMERNAPLPWLLSSNFIDFFDTVFTEQQGTEMPLVLVFPVIIFILIGLITKRYNGGDLLYGLVFGAVWAIVVLLYVLYRKDSVTVTNISVQINVSYLISILLLSGSGFFMYRRAKSTWGRVCAVLVANFNHFVTSLLFSLAALVKVLFFGITVSISKASYPWGLGLIELVVGAVFFFLVFSMINRFAGSHTTADQQ